MHTYAPDPPFYCFTVLLFHHFNALFIMICLLSTFDDSSVLDFSCLNL